MEVVNVHNKNTIRSKVDLLIENYSVWKYLYKLLLLVFITACLIIFFANDYSPVTGYVSSSIIYFFSTIIASLIFLRTRRWAYFFSIVYLVRLIIGFLFYLVFLDPNYFSSTGTNVMMHSEYQAVYDFVYNIINGGNIPLLYDTSTLTHKEIWIFISTIQKPFGAYLLNISPMNSFFSVLITINLILISKYCMKLSAMKVRYIAVIVAYIPFTLISSNFYRDITGIALMSIALTLLMFSKNRFITLIMMTVGSLLFYLQRTPYVLILPFSYIALIILSQYKYKNSRVGIFSYVIVSILLAIIIPNFITLIDNEANEEYLSGAMNVNYLYYPIKFVLGLIGPFPWNQWEGNPNQIPLYFQGVLNLSILIYLITNFRKYIRFRNFDLLVISGFMLLLIGLFTTMMHVSYVSIGVLFIIPWLIKSINFTKFKRVFLFSFVFLLFLNVFVIVFFGNLGISSLWK